MNLRYIYIVVALLFSLKSFGQGSNYSQYGRNIVPLNNAGSFLNAEGALNLIGRQQWSGLEGAPKNYFLSASMPLWKTDLNGGLSVRHESMSVERLTEVVAFGGKSVRLTENQHLALSIGVGISNYKGNYSGLSNTDPAFKDDVRETSGLLSVGLMFYRPDKYYAGISIPRLAFSKLGLSDNDENYSQLNQYHFTLGAVIKLDDKFDLKPAGLLSWSSGLKLQADVSAMVFMDKAIGLGLNMRNYGEVAGMAYFNVKRLGFGYSYQFNTSNDPLSRMIGNNTHEIGLNYRFGKGVLGLL
jgi:type IX secretion system PorP/SprF family membrane protein